MLACNDVFRRYRTAGGSVEVLRGADLRVNGGEVAVILGPSGSGKSTLLHLLAGLDRPDAGEIWWDDFPVHEHTPSELAARRALTIGLVFQNHYLLDDLTVLENVLLPQRISGKVDEERGRSLLERVGLSDRADFLPERISGGEKQRAAVARSLSLSPSFIIADEPTGSLDHARALDVFALLLELAAEEGSGVVIVTHDETLLDVVTSADVGSQVLRLEDGILTPDTVSVARHIGEGNVSADTVI